MSVKKAGIILLSTLSLAAAIGGCSSSTKEGGSLGSVALVGDTPCFQCHAATADPLTGETFIEQYQRSLHAELGCESCHGGGAQHNGVGLFPYDLSSNTTDAKKAERCAMCHDGVTTYMGKVAPLSSSPNFQNGNHANPFSEEEAKEAKCSRCHSHEGSILYGKEGFTGSQTVINNTAYQPVLARDPVTFNTIRCATCHEHGGNIRQTKTRDLSGNIVTWDPNANKVVDQYDLCTSCHNMTTNEGKLIGSGNTLQVYSSAAAGSGFKNISTSAYYHSTAWYRILPSTHYDQSASRTTSSGTTIEGYVIRKNTKNPCFDCHGHEFQTNTRRVHPQASATVKGRPNTIFLDWAQSGHAGKLLTQKIVAAAGTTDRTTAQVDAVMNAGATDASGIGWTHYNWDNSTGNASSNPDPDRKSCQRCHTATGASNFLNSPTTYNAANNDFSHLTGNNPAFAWGIDPATGRSSSSFKTSPQQELLYCWGCHTNAGTGKLRNPGAVLHRYSAANYKYTVQFPESSGSNVCIACHTGRETGESIKTNRDADGVLSFVNSHYLSAGGQLYGITGYEFAGLDYANPAAFRHDKIGTTSAPGTGSNGPCAGCHMNSNTSHRFTNVSTSGGAITGITSKSCVTCHSTMTPSTLNTLREEYDAALEGLKAALAAKGIHFGEAHPYFYTAPYVAGGSNTGFTNWAEVYGLSFWKDTMGSAFNANLLIHDPGGFAHNSFYSKRLIWDSIDFIDDGTLNNSVPATLTTVLPAGQTLTDAQSYLGTSRP